MPLFLRSWDDRGWGAETLERVVDSDAVRTIRLLIDDRAADSAERIFDDDEVLRLHLHANGNEYRAAANGLRIIAGSQAMILKRITVQGLATDGASVANALRMLASDYDRQAILSYRLSDGIAVWP